VLALLTHDPGLYRQACDQDGQCEGWSFVKASALQADAVCALKGTIGPSQADQKVISGLRGEPTYDMTGEARVENLMGIGRKASFLAQKKPK